MTVTNTRIFGASGIPVPAIGVGTASWGAAMQKIARLAVGHLRLLLA